MTTVDLREHARTDEERERVINAALEYFESIAAHLARERGMRPSVVVTGVMNISEVRQTLVGAVKDGLSDHDLARALVDTAYAVILERLRGGA